MFNPTNLLGVPADHPFLAPELSVDTFRQRPELISEAIQLLGVVGGGLFNQAVGDGGLRQTVAGPQGAADEGMRFT